MKGRKYLALILILVSLFLGIVFYQNLEYPKQLMGYFSQSYIGQLGPLAICVELLTGGIYLFMGHRKSNFVLALFAFTALLDIAFHLTGLFESGVPVYGMFIFSICAILALWLAFSNAFDLGKISLPAVVGSFVVGNAIEFYFNYF